MVDYDIFLQSPRKTTFEKKEKTLISESQLIPLSEIPSKIKLKINSIQPNTYNITKSIRLDEKSVVETQAGEYLMDIRDSKQHKITILIEDKVRGLKYEQELNTHIGMDEIL